MIGDYSHSSAALISHKNALQRGSRDKIIIATNNNLGPINKIRLWHDNSGPSPDWYVNRIIIRDLQNNMQFFFIIRSWLSLENGDGDIEMTIAATGNSLL